jgi:hypothetical protein
MKLPKFLAIFALVALNGATLFERVDLIEVTPDRGAQPHRFRLRVGRGLVTLEDAHFGPGKFRQLDTLGFECLRISAAGRRTRFPPSCHSMK